MGDESKDAQGNRRRMPTPDGPTGMLALILLAWAALASYTGVAILKAAGSAISNRLLNALPDFFTYYRAQPLHIEALLSLVFGAVVSSLALLTYYAVLFKVSHDRRKAVTAAHVTGAIVADKVADRFEPRFDALDQNAAAQAVRDETLLGEMHGARKDILDVGSGVQAVRGDLAALADQIKPQPANASPIAHITPTLMPRHGALLG